MARVKMLKDVNPYSLNGLGGELLYAKKGDVVEVPDQYAAGIIRSKFAKSTKEALPEEPEDNSDDVSFGLDSDNKAHILGLKKNDIETILRLYGVEVDKRQSMDSIRKLLAETVSQALPDGVETTEDLASFYSTGFEVQLDLEFYGEDVTKMAEAMGAILTEALEVEGS